MSQAAENIQFHVSPLCEYTLADLRASKRYIWHEGGSRSSKTYSIAASIWLTVMQTGATVDVVRMSNPAIKGSVLLDIKEVGRRMDYYRDSLHNKTEQVIRMRGGRPGVIRYYGIDDEQKVHGWKRHHLWMNEANEINNDKRRQLWMRTTGSIILDHNPTIDDDHWIVKQLAKRVASGECSHYHSTYRDNAFLEETVIREIEAMQFDDEWGWTVYGLGLRGSNPAAVFTDVTFGNFDPQGETVYGTDFGMKDPFVVTEWGWRDSNPPAVPKATLYCRPWLYATNMTTGEAIAELNARGADKSIPMWCDSAEPDRIRELKQSGYNARPVAKTTGAREAGYDWLKRHRIVVDPSRLESEAVRGELKRTRHYQKPGTDVYTDKVVDVDDHVADTARYGAFSRWGLPRHSKLLG